MTVKIAITNHKGGSAKTTSVTNIAGSLAKDFKKRVLVVDCDNSANLTEGIAHNQEPEEYLVDVIEENCEDEYIPAIESIIVPTDFENLYLLPTRRRDLIKVNKMMDEAEFSTNFLFQNILSEADEYFDFVLFDCAGNDGNPEVTNNILCCCDYVLVPFEPNADSVNGYVMTKARVKSMKRDNRNLKILGSFITKYQKATKLSREMDEFAESVIDDELIPIKITNSVIVGNARLYCTPLAYFNPSAKTAKDYKALAKYVIDNTK